MTAGFISRSHRAIHPFTLFRAETVDQAAARMADGALAHAGGIDVVERLQAGERAGEIVDISRLGELQLIEVVGQRLHIGAGVTHAQLESDAIVADNRPDLAAAWRTVGNVRIRRTGTIGGNLMAFDPTYDAAPILAATGAELIFRTNDGELRSDVASRPDNLLLTRVEVPLSGSLRFDRVYKPVATIAVDRFLAIGCAHSDLQVLELAAPLGDALNDMDEPLSDSTASATYRRRLLGVLANRMTGGES